MKTLLKNIVHCIVKVCVLPFIMLCMLVYSDEFFCSIGQLLSLIPGKIGSYVRIAFYNGVLTSCSKRGYFGFGSFLSHRNAIIEDDFFIGAYCIIGMACLERNCTIGSHVSILSGKHQHGYRQVGVPVQSQAGSFEQVRLGENCWVGERSVVMADLGQQCVVGAGSVVTKPFGALSILAGNPARILGQVGEL